MLCGDNAEGLSASLEDYLEVIFHLSSPTVLQGQRISPIK